MEALSSYGRRRACTLLGRQLLPYDGGRALLKKAAAHGEGRQNGCIDRSVGFLGAMRDASFNARRRRQRSVRRLVNSDDYDFAAQWRVASEFVEASGARVPHEALDWEAMDATDLL